MICSVCDEAITQPIGVQRLTQQMTVWLREEAPVHIPKVMDLKTYFNSYPRVDACIFTQENMAVCSHCVVKEAFELLENLTYRQKEAFLRQFTYEIYNVDGIELFDDVDLQWK